MDRNPDCSCLIGDCPCYCLSYPPCGICAEFKTLSPANANKLRIKGGIQVVSVGDGKLKSAGIKEGFIITSVNRRAIYDLQELKLIINNLEGGVYIEGVYPNGISAYYAFGI